MFFPEKKIKKHTVKYAFPGQNQIFRLFGFNSADRTNCSASSAINAFVRIYNIDVTGRNGFYGTFIDTSSTCCAVFGNFVCHGKLTVRCK